MIGSTGRAGQERKHHFMFLSKRATAEFFGTFWLVFGGCGSAVLASSFPGGLGIGFVGVSLAFWPTVLTMAYVIAQVLGGLAGAGVLYTIASGKAGFSLAGGFASNGFGDHSPGGYTMMACLVAEVVLTFVFLMINLGATDKRAPSGFAPIAIG